MTLEVIKHLGRLVRLATLLQLSDFLNHTGGGEVVVERKEFLDRKANRERRDEPGHEGIGAGAVGGGIEVWVGCLEALFDFFADHG